MSRDKPRADQPDEPSAPPAQLARVDRARALILAALREKQPLVKATIAEQIAAEYQVSRRTGYFDYEAAWAALRQTHAKEIEEIHRDIVAALGDRVDWLLELVELRDEARAEGDIRLAYDIHKQIGKELKHSELERPASEVNVHIDARVMPPLQRLQRIAQLRARLPAPKLAAGKPDDGDALS